MMSPSGAGNDWLTVCCLSVPVMKAGEDLRLEGGSPPPLQPSPPKSHRSLSFAVVTPPPIPVSPSLLTPSGNWGGV